MPADDDRAGVYAAARAAGHALRDLTFLFLGAGSAATGSGHLIARALGAEGLAPFASGSPFAPVERRGRRHRPAQANNVYIFPGIGLGALAVEAREVSDRMFLAAARALADRVAEEDLAEGVAAKPPAADLRDTIRSSMYAPWY